MDYFGYALEPLDVAFMLFDILLFVIVVWGMFLFVQRLTFISLSDNYCYIWKLLIIIHASLTGMMTTHPLMTQLRTSLSESTF